MAERPPSPYAVQAAIAALHAEAPTAAETDWRQIVALYAVLLRLAPSPVIELNHAAALSMTDGPAAALLRVDALAARGELAGYDVLPAVRADLLRRLGRRRRGPRRLPGRAQPRPLRPRTPLLPPPHRRAGRRSCAIERKYPRNLRRYSSPRAWNERAASPRVTSRETPCSRP